VSLIDEDVKTTFSGTIVAATDWRKPGREDDDGHVRVDKDIRTVTEVDGSGLTCTVKTVSEEELSAEYSEISVVEVRSTIVLQQGVVTSTFDPCTVSRGMKCVAKSSV